jgi:hypothetical protein
MASKIQPPREAIQGYVLSLALMRETDEGWWPEAIVGTGFLVAEGRGLGVTATHVAKVLENHPAAAVALFVQVSGKWEALPILKFDPHPVEDVALFRVIDDDYFRHSPSPQTSTTHPHRTSCGDTRKTFTTIEWQTSAPRPRSRLFSGTYPPSDQLRSTHDSRP